MAYEPIQIPPGFKKNVSETEAIGRFVDGDKVRFEDGFKPSKIGGWTKQIQAQIVGKARGFWSWNDNNGQPLISFGTNSYLYGLVGTTTLQDITPIRQTFSGLTDIFSTTSGEITANVNITSHGVAKSGDRVLFTAASTVGGEDFNGEYIVSRVVDTDNVEVELSTEAASTDSGGGACTAVFYLASGTAEASFGVGWGTGSWGQGTWGTPRASSGTVVAPRVWALDNYGQDLLALAQGTELYQWNATTDARALMVANSPKGNSMFVTEERYPVILGAYNSGSLAPLDIAWPDQNDITDWTPTATNTSNRRKLSGGSKLLAGTRLSSGLSMLWSDTTAFIMQFIGGRTVYSTRAVGSNCGLVGPAAKVEINGIAYWMSQDKFMMFDGSVKQIPNWSDIDPFVFLRLNRMQREKSHAVYNKQFNEIWWFFPSVDSEECAEYVMVSLDSYAWVTGTMSRTAGGANDDSIGGILMISANGYVYKHEDGKNADGAAIEAYLRSGRASFNKGNTFMDVWGIMPDFYRLSGDLVVDISIYEYPMSTVAEHTDTATLAVGVTQESLRTGGRQVAFTVTSNEIDGDFSFGTMSFDIEGSGIRA